MRAIRLTKKKKSQKAEMTKMIKSLFTTALLTFLEICLRRQALKLFGTGTAIDGKHLYETETCSGGRIKASS